MKPYTTNLRSVAGINNQISQAGFTRTTTESPSSNLSPRMQPDPRLVDSKTHNRQTSIVHGIQHSRNGSFAGSSSPLSPQIIAAAGADASNMGDSSLASTMSSMASSGSFNFSTALVADRVIAPSDGSTNTSTQSRVERIHSGRSRRDYGHHPSHSRHHHKEELKTVGEYALHVLFTSVSKLNQHYWYCPNYPGPVHSPGRREDKPMCYYTT